MNCSRVSNQLSAYIDRELTGGEMLQLRRHLSDCDGCRAEYEALCRMKMLLGRLPAPEPAREFAAATMRRLAASGGSAGPRSARSVGARMTASRSAVVCPSLRQLMLPGGRRLPRFVGPGAWRLSVGLVTAALLAALVFTSLVLHKPRHSDALVATSPVPILQGQDIFESQGVSDWRNTGLPEDVSDHDRNWMRQPEGQSALKWMTVSLQSEGRLGLR